MLVVALTAVAAVIVGLVDRRRQRYRDALEEVQAVLGTGACAENGCAGCQWEVGEAVRVVGDVLASRKGLIW